MIGSLVIAECVVLLETVRAIANIFRILPSRSSKIPGYEVRDNEVTNRK